MVINVPKESFVVGYERDNGSLILYVCSKFRIPERFDNYDDALKLAQGLEDKVGRFKDSISEWQVYRMKFEKVGS